MENLIQQELVLMYQTDKKTDEKMLFKVNKAMKSTTLVFGYETYVTSVATNTVYTKTVRALMKLPTTDEKKVVRYIQHVLGTKLPIDTFTDLDKVAENFDNDVQYPLAINARIATQEFALAIPRYKRGNAMECIDAYIKMLDKYAKFATITVKITNVIRHAVRNTNDKLLLQLMDNKTGLFDVELLKKLDPLVLAEICEFVDKRLHHGSKKGDNAGLFKRQVAGSASLQTEKGEYIFVTNVFLDKPDTFADYEDRFVDHDRDNKDYVKDRKDRVTASLLAEAPDTDEDTTDTTEDTSTDTTDTTADLPAGDTTDVTADTTADTTDTK